MIARREHLHRPHSLLRAADSDRRRGSWRAPGEPRLGTFIHVRRHHASRAEDKLRPRGRGRLAHLQPQSIPLPCQHQLGARRRAVRTPEIPIPLRRQVIEPRQRAAGNQPRRPAGSHHRLQQQSAGLRAIGGPDFAGRLAQYPQHHRVLTRHHDLCRIASVICPDIERPGRAAVVKVKPLLVHKEHPVSCRRRQGHTARRAHARHRLRARRCAVRAPPCPARWIIRPARKNTQLGLVYRSRSRQPQRADFRAIRPPQRAIPVFITCREQHQRPQRLKLTRRRIRLQRRHLRHWHGPARRHLLRAPEFVAGTRGVAHKIGLPAVQQHGRRIEVRPPSARHKTPPLLRLRLSLTAHTQNADQD